MDCIQGELLIYRIKGYPEMEKSLLFGWIHQLLKQMEQYQRCHKGQNYKYINPYSVLVTKNEGILLLDLEAKSNEFVLKNMQKRAMKNHFVKPIVHMKATTNLTYDLYGFGKTVQFLLANTDVDPPLSKKEIRQFEKIIQKCLGEYPTKQYENLKQVQKELPVLKEQSKEMKKGKRVIAGAAGALLVFAAVVWLREKGAEGTRFLAESSESVSLADTTQVESESTQYEVEETTEEETVVEEENTEQTEKNDETENSGLQAESEAEQDNDIVDELLESLQQEISTMETELMEGMSDNTSETIEKAENIQNELTRYLAFAYDQEGMTEAALTAYEEVCQSVSDQDVLQSAYIRRIALEKENQNVEEAKKIMEEAMTRVPEIQESEEFQGLQSAIEEMAAGEMNMETGENGT